MIEIIHFLQENPEILQLLKDQKLSLVGVSAADVMAILEAFTEDFRLGYLVWA